MGDGDGNKDVRQGLTMAVKRAMVTATRVAGNKEGNGNKDGNGNSKEGGRQQRGQW
jgi:hypothetical protein